MKKVISLFLALTMLLSITAGLDFSSKAFYPFPSTGKCGDNVSYSFNSSTGVLTISGTGKMNDTVTGMGNVPFQDSDNIKRVIINSGVTRVGSAAFYYCTNITSVSLPNTVASIGANAFDHCSSLSTINIPNSVKSIENGAFSNCSSLSSLPIGNSVTSIGGYAYADCNRLTAINIPDSVTKIEYNAFSNCNNVKKVTIGSGLAEIGNYALNCGNSHTEFEVSNQNNYYSAENGVLFNKNKTRLIQYCAGKQSTSYTPPNSVTTINSAAFLYNEFIKEVTLPNNVSSIESIAFMSCTHLEKIVIKNKNCAINQDSRTIPASAVIYGYSGSTAETYAKNNNRSFLVIQDDVFKPMGSISSTNNASDSQTVTLTLSDNTGVAGYYWGTSSNYASNTYTATSAGSITKNISSSGTYYLTVKDTSGNISDTVSITFFKTTLNANGGSVSPASVLTKSGNSFTFPTPSRSGYSYQGWSTSSTAASGVKSLSPNSNSTYYAIWKNGESEPPSTSKTFTVNDVTYSFSNSNSGFGYPDDYRIPLSSFQLIYGKTNLAKELWKEEGVWGGNCYGFSTTSAMFAADNDINVSMYKSSASKISDLSPSDKGTNGIKLQSFMEAMQISQCESTILKATVSNNLTKLYNAVSNISKTGKPVAVGVVGKDGGHEILAYGIKKVSSKEYKVLIYDSNYPKKERYLTLKKNNSGKFTYWSYTLWEGCTMSSSKKDYIDYTPLDAYYKVWKNGSNDGKKSKYNTLIINTQNAELYDYKNNAIATVVDGELKTNNENIYKITPRGLINGKTNSVSTSSVLIVPTDQYTIKNTDSSVKEFEASMVNIDRAAEVTTSSNEVEFGIDDQNGLNDISVNTKKNQSYSITMSSTDPTDSKELVVSGTSTGKEIQASIVNGNVSLNNYSNASVSVNGYSIKSTSGTDISGGGMFFESKTVEFSGCPVSPKISVMVNGKTLTEGKDYVAVTSNNRDVGTGTVVAYGIGSYKGSLTSTFNIVRAQLANVTVSNLKASYEYTKKQVKPGIKLKYNGVSLVEGVDFKRTYYNNVNEGKAVMIVEGLGNFLGMKTLTYQINCTHKKAITDNAVAATFKKAGKTKGSHCALCGKVIKAQKKTAKLVSPSISNLKAGKKSFTANWNKASTVGGYQIQYSTDSKFKNAKSVTIKGNKTTKKSVSKLKGRKKYFVRVRAYKKINGKTVYSSWSKAKTVKTK